MYLCRFITFTAFYGLVVFLILRLWWKGIMDGIGDDEVGRFVVMQIVWYCGFPIRILRSDDNICSQNMHERKGSEYGCLLIS